MLKWRKTGQNYIDRLSQFIGGYKGKGIEWVGEYEAMKMLVGHPQLGKLDPQC